MLGYSIGTWSDTDGDGQYDTLEVETRNLRGPRAFDAAGIPFHPDNQTVVKEHIHWNKAEPDKLTDEITTIDNALTRPWTVTKTYIRQKAERPEWEEDACTEGNGHVGIAGQNYFLSGDGSLMPAKRGQAPPDLRYFKRRRSDSAPSPFFEREGVGWGSADGAPSAVACGPFQGKTAARREFERL